MDKNPYTDRIAYLESELRTNNRQVIFVTFIGLLRILMILAIFIGFIVHWVKNDTLTFIQNVKWSLSSYWWAYLFSFAVHFLNSYIRDIINNRRSLQRQLAEAKKKAELSQKIIDIRNHDK